MNSLKNCLKGQLADSISSIKIDEVRHEVRDNQLLWMKAKNFAQIPYWTEYQLSFVSLAQPSRRKNKKKNHFDQIIGEDQNDVVGKSSKFFFSFMYMKSIYLYTMMISSSSEHARALLRKGFFYSLLLLSFLFLLVFFSSLSPCWCLQHPTWFVIWFFSTKEEKKTREKEDERDSSFFSLLFLLHSV